MMDMDMKSTWLYQPVVFESSRAFTCDGFKTHQQCVWYQHRWHFWYIADWVYALPTVAFFMCCIGIFIISYIAHRLLAFRTVSGSKVYRRLNAFTRYYAYRGYRIEALRWNSAPLGILILAAVGVIFFACMTLIPQPYYWPGSDAVWGNSPPLGTRSGWMALACMPFVFATASKANWITLLTGVSHEKLQVFHRWISYAFFILALFHTFPFIVWHIRNHDMVEQFTVTNYFTYWTGVVALAFQAWLTFASFSWLRNLSYEFFKVAHFVSVILFVLIFFWHCGGTLTSWDYFVATAAVYVPALVFPWMRTLFEYGLGQKAKLTVEENDFIRITIPSNAIWSAGQHCFLRFTGFGIHAFTSHPFTVCSLPPTLSGHPSELVFYARLRGGFTRKLHEYARKQRGRSVGVMVDGPYGGINNSRYHDSDRVLVIAGGSGAGWSLPFVEQFVRSQVESDKDTSVKSLQVTLATRDTATRVWFHHNISELMSRYCSDTSSISALGLEVYLTGEAEELATEPKVLADLHEPSPSSSDAVSSDEEAANDKENAASRIRSDRGLGANFPELHGRPALSQIIEKEVTQAAQAGQSIGVFVCGPETMQQDVRNAVANSNWHLGGGASSIDNCKGVYLHLEHFSWA